MSSHMQESPVLTPPPVSNNPAQLQHQGMYKYTGDAARQLKSSASTHVPTGQASHQEISCMPLTWGSIREKGNYFSLG